MKQHCPSDTSPPRKRRVLLPQTIQNETPTYQNPRNPNSFLGSKTNCLISFQALCAEQQDIEWMMDSACSLHMTGRLDYLRDFMPVSEGGFVTFGNDANGKIMGYGVLTNGNFTIRRVAYVHCLKHNLISVWQLCNTGHRVEFDRGFSYI